MPVSTPVEGLVVVRPEMIRSMGSVWRLTAAVDSEAVVVAVVAAVARIATKATDAVTWNWRRC